MNKKLQWNTENHSSNIYEIVASTFRIASSEFLIGNLLDLEFKLKFDIYEISREKFGLEIYLTEGLPTIYNYYKFNSIDEAKECAEKLLEKIRTDLISSLQKL